MSVLKTLKDSGKGKTAFEEASQPAAEANKVAPKPEPEVKAAAKNKTKAKPQAPVQGDIEEAIAESKLDTSTITLASLKKMVQKDLDAMAAQLDIITYKNVLWQKLPNVKKREAIADNLGLLAKQSTESVAKTGVDPNDPLVKMAVQISKLGSEDEAVAMLKDNQQIEGMTDYALGGVLGEMESHGWFKGYATLKDYAKAELGLEYRKLRYLIDIYRTVIDVGLTKTQVDKVGWTKLRALLRVLKSENAEKWIEYAAANAYQSIVEAVKAELAAKNASGASVGDVTEPQTLVSKTFKLHTDQAETVNTALAQVKEAIKSDHDSVALETICADYMSGLGTDKAASVAAKVATAAAASYYSVDGMEVFLKGALASYDGDVDNYMQVLMEAIERVTPQVKITCET